jgi:large subunit ribosomal protein L6
VLKIMSRIGKIPVSVSKEVKVAVGSSVVKIEGPKGKLALNIPHGIKVDFKDDQLVIDRLSNAKQNRANHGTIRARLASMVEGVVAGHKKELEIQGLGFRVKAEGKKLVFNLGLSHPVEFVAPEGVEVKAANQTSITVEGSDKVLVGEVAARIRDLKPAEPYKGKGIRYLGEVILRKQGKSVSK